MNGWLLKTAVASTLALFTLCSAASQIQVSPIKLEFLPGQRVQQLRLGNPGDSDIVVQLELYAWDQLNGEDKLTPNRDFLATPPILEIAAHSRKTVRIGPRKLPQGQCETAYRVVVTEIPPKAGPNRRPVKFRSQVRLPLFARSQDSCKTQLSWQQQGQQIKFSNSGEGYTQIRSAILQLDEQSWPLEMGGVGYILAGQERWADIPKDLPANINGLKLHLDTVHGKVSGTLTQQP